MGRCPAGLRHSRRGPRAGLPRPVVAGRGVRHSRVPRGRGGAQTAGPGRTAAPARSRTASPAPDAQHATSTAASDRGPRIIVRPGSPRAYLPSVSTPPRRPGCEAPLLSAEAPGLRAPTRGWLGPAPAGPEKAPPPPDRGPAPARQSPVLIGSSSHPSRFGPSPAPPENRREGEPPPFQSASGPEPCPGSWWPGLPPRLLAKAPLQSPCLRSYWPYGDGSELYVKADFTATWFNRGIQMAPHSRKP